MNKLWHPRGVAVVGASATAGSLGHQLLTFLRQHGYSGDIYPVNPRYSEIEGLPCFASVADCPGPVDLALILVGAERVLAALEDCASKGVAYAVVHSSGFSETGAGGKELEQRMVELARRTGMRLIGPNCIGLVSTPDSLVAGFSPLFAGAVFKPGTLGLVTQSGALGYGFASLALEQGLAFSRIINTGNECDLVSADLVEELLNDDATSAVLVYSEGIKQPQRWRSIAALSQRVGKPVIMYKVGRSEAGSRAAASHTAALAGNDQVLDAAFRQLGFLRVEDLEEMIDVATAFAQPKRPAGPRVGVVTSSGGAGIAAADALTRAGLSVPTLTGEVRRSLEAILPAFGSAANPVDVTAQIIVDTDLCRDSLRIMAESSDLDILLVCFTTLGGEAAERMVHSLIEFARETPKPILVSKTGAEDLAPGLTHRLLNAGIPVFRTPERAARAAGALVRFARVGSPALAAGPLPPAHTVPAGWPTAGSAPLTEREAKELLRRAGLPATREALAATPDEAVRLAEEVGFPVVLKIDSPDIAHKTEAGGVRLDLRDAAAVADAFGQIMDGARTYMPGARLNGCLVQEMVPSGVEMLVGVSPSPLGPVITVGLGGIFVEVMGDVAQRLAPLTRGEAEAMLKELRGYKLLTGVRGRPQADVAALADVIVRVSELAVQWPGEWELDLNPVVVLPEGQGVRIVDALLVMH